MSNGGMEVPPLKRVDIAQIADFIRRAAFPTREPKAFPIVDLIEFTLPGVIDDFAYAIVDEEEIGGLEAVTIPARKLIKIRADIYSQACNDEGRARFTLAHEVGHLMLHRNVGLARGATRSAVTPAYRNSEWQADEFAAALLMPHAHVRQLDGAAAVADTLKVTIQAARVRIEKLGIKKPLR